MLKYFLPLGVLFAMIPLQAQNTPMQNSANQNQYQNNSQQSASQQNNLQQQSQSQPDRMKASSDISSVLNETNQARQAIANDNEQQAMQHVNNALWDLDQARTAAPNEKFVPLYTETDTYSVMGPLIASRNANQLNQPGQTTPTGQANTNQSGVTVQKAYGEYTSVKLDTRLAETHLEAAKAELEDNNFAKADAGLKAAQDAVIVTSNEAQMPLLRARENLMLARSAANSGDYQEMTIALRATDRSLNNYVRANGANSSEAKALAQQIADYDRSNSHDTTGVATKISDWWNQTTNLVGSGTSNQNTSNISE